MTKVAHISDLHVLDLAGVPLGRFLNKRITGYANLRFKRNHVHRSEYVRALARALRDSDVDHVAITGDLTNLALETEFVAVKRIIEDDLGFDSSKVSIVPGNHDSYTAGAHRSGRFMEYFGNYVTSDLPVGPDPFPFVRLRGPVAIVGLSSAIPQMPMIAAGKVGEAQLRALETVLGFPEVKSRTLMLLLHHPIINPASKRKAFTNGLWDAEKLLHALRGVERGLLAHGHLHARMLRTVDTKAGLIAVAGATSASLHHADPNKMAGYNLYEFGERGELIHVSARVFVPERGELDEREIPLFA
ncbi:MAG: metallophosphoesterase [Polyangiaceae bacterium]